jgi:hypothetical protein
MKPGQNRRVVADSGIRSEVRAVVVDRASVASLVGKRRNSESKAGCGSRPLMEEIKDMATRSRTTFKKRQKEIARMEWQRDKAAKRMQRKLTEKQPEGTDEPSDSLTSDTDTLTPEEPSSVGE